MTAAKKRVPVLHRPKEDWLLGKHILQAVYPNARHPFDDEVEAFGIQMDNRYILFLEVNDDGYRSSLADVMFGSGSPLWKRDTWLNIPVTVRHRTISEHYEGENCDLYEFRRAGSSRPGLIVGTDNISDYYPSFVCHYDAAAWGQI